MPSVLLEQSIVRAVVSLCTLAAQTDMDDVRDDIRDSAVTLIRLCMSDGETTEQFRQWCAHAVALLDAVASDEHVPAGAYASAKISVLRLQACIGPILFATKPAPKTKVAPSRTSARPLNGNQKKVLQFIRENPDLRTKDLIERFSEELSDRTVKRVLKELVSAGSLERRQHEGAVLYRILDRAE